MSCRCLGLAGLSPAPCSRGGVSERCAHQAWTGCRSLLLGSTFEGFRKQWHQNVDKGATFGKFEKGSFRGVQSSFSLPASYGTRELEGSIRSTFPNTPDLLPSFGLYLTLGRWDHLSAKLFFVGLLFISPEPWDF